MLERTAGRWVTGRMAFFVSGLIDVGVLARYLMARRWHRRHAGRSRTVVVVAVLGTLLGSGWGLGLTRPSPARADTTEQSILMDDGAFIYSSPAEVLAHLRQVAALGVNTVKVSMVWSLVAPDADATRAPHFDATDPDAYPAGSWTRYDTLVREADELGMGVYFQLTAPAPLWATNPRVSGREHPWSHEVNATDFADFVRAVGARYSGRYPVAGDGDESGPEAPGAAPSSGASGTGTTTTSTTVGASGASSTTGAPGAAGAAGAAGAGPTIPAVSMWGIWNEPNETGWLSPQTTRVHGHEVAVAPVLERELIDGGYRALTSTGHADDTILIGETASGGNTHVIPFIQTLYCLGADNRPLRGAAAAREACPTDGPRRAFVSAHPGLFKASGWAHHPYSFDHSPATPFPHAPDTITLANIGRLEHALDAADAAYGQPGGLSLYFTEWGFKSNPPNPFVHTSLNQQATWMDEGWYLSTLMPRVKAMAQELLYDQPPTLTARRGTLAYWNTIDSGLEFQDGRAKPSYAAFRLPIWLPHAVTGHRVAVWVDIRPAAESHNPFGLLEYQAPGSRHWSPLRLIVATNPRGFLVTHVTVPHPGTVRLIWRDPASGAVDASRPVSVASASPTSAHSRVGARGSGTGALSSSSRR